MDEREQSTTGGLSSEESLRRVLVAGPSEEGEEREDTSAARPEVAGPKNQDDLEILDRLMHFEQAVIDGTDPGPVREQLSEYIARRGL